LINFLKEEHGAWMMKRWKFVLVSSLLVVIFCFLVLSESWEKIDGKSCIYDTEVCLADTLPWLEAGL
jgi:hypothetical protein